jgi:hypothetical protein
MERNSRPTCVGISRCTFSRWQALGTVLSYGILSCDAFGYKPNLVYKPFLSALPYASMPLATDHVQVNPNKSHIRIC